MPRVFVTFPSYNTRRYGKPWIAKVTGWPIGKNPVLDFGATTSLTTEIDATPGDVVRWGQKDGRGGNTTANWGIVLSDLSIDETSSARCREHWLLRAASVVAEAEG
jgi:hypothetical protein